MNDKLDQKITEALHEWADHAPLRPTFSDVRRRVRRRRQRHVAGAVAPALLGAVWLGTRSTTGAELQSATASTAGVEPTNLSVPSQTNPSVPNTVANPAATLPMNTQLVLTPDSPESTPSDDAGATVPNSATTPGGHRVLAFGDSVMAGAAHALSEFGFAAVVEESLQGAGMVQNISTNVDYERSFDTVVIQVGTNGPVTQQQLDDMAAFLTDIPHVFFLTVKAPKEWIAPNNALIRALPERHPNVEVIDWETLSAEIAGELSPGDGGVHLGTAAAIDFYTHMVLDAIDAENPSNAGGG